MHGVFPGHRLGNVPALITDPNCALTSIIIADTWEWFPFTMLIGAGGAADDAAGAAGRRKVDGASPWQLTRYVTLPFIQGVLAGRRAVSADRFDQGLPADLILDRRRAGQPLPR